MSLSDEDGPAFGVLKIRQKTKGTVMEWAAVVGQTVLFNGGYTMK
ncbi:hypothetical protein [Gluconobacter kanchanaburiensis]|uniref:Uncharacterized protein n=1 Tax=Gluconobacter kanchanaburiensis NBRC 103587 TaxID=1307948 RepID=A0A511BB11_9PROT|nr:hypothetical protein [Gluconobacter kanchanaburiensis]GBR71143.1 hypothetical protein AA103587_2247 [Gluconobacter kanchanaburiensis NBRC 103587]GEK96813.1 hypothetical protein GKA01_20100 [Gluconobacter kanchanaburiensis NBRC 103587]